jgi:peroxiredoxin Q/BCP
MTLLKFTTFCSYFTFALFFSFGSQSAFALSAGDAAPSFSAPDQDGKSVTLADYKGKYLLLYFYPKDQTPGCTKEACNLRDQFTEFKKNEISILGVSVQDAKSHRQFREKFHIPFPLLVDENGELAKKFGIEKYPVVGLLKRQSVLIGKDQKVVQIYHDVDPDTHTAEVLKDVQGHERK